MRRIICVLFVLSMIAGCSSTTEDEVSVGGAGGGEVPAAPQNSNKFDHYNPLAWEGRGSALVLCSGTPRMDTCSIEGRTMALHGSQDHGRDVWTIYNKTRLGGTITCQKGSESYAYDVSGSGGTQYGNCN